MEEEGGKAWNGGKDGMEWNGGKNEMESSCLDEKWKKGKGEKEIMDCKCLQSYIGLTCLPSFCVVLMAVAGVSSPVPTSPCHVCLHLHEEAGRACESPTPTHTWEWWWEKEGSASLPCLPVCLSPGVSSLGTS